MDQRSDPLNHGGRPTAVGLFTRMKTVFCKWQRRGREHERVMMQVAVMLAVSREHLVKAAGSSAHRPTQGLGQYRKSGEGRQTRKDQVLNAKALNHRRL